MRQHFKRDHGTNMGIRMLLRSLLAQPGRAASAFLAVVVAAAAASAMMNLYADVESKLRQEFRGYGSNIVVLAHDGGALPSGALSIIDRELAGRGTAVPFAYAVARTEGGEPVVVAGTDFTRVKKLNSWWSVTAWLDTPRQALMGRRAAAVVAPDGRAFVLTFQAHSLQLTPAGTLRTGAAEDSRVYIDLKQFEAWTGVRPETIEISVSGTPAEIQTTLRELSAALPGADVRPVRQVVEGEARVLGKTRLALLACIIVIIFTAALCVAATLTAWVLDRRRDFAVMKALGASQRTVSVLFAAQVGMIGALGAVLGFGIGLGTAEWIAAANFHSTVTPRWGVFPMVLAGSVVVAIASAILPMGLLRKVQPATMLRGE